MIPLTGLLPSADPTTPGLMLDCVNVVPSKSSMDGAPSEQDAIIGLAALAAECRGSAILTNTSGTRRHFAGTQTQLYELGATAWTLASSSTYTGTSENRWLFDQFGNVALATNDTEKIQWSISGAFADVTAGPKARIIFSLDNFVMALNTNDSINGDRPDGWMCSAFQDYSSWTANVTTQATVGRLIGNGGELTAGARLGQYAVAYKKTSMWLGSYVGPPTVWQWDRVPGEIGCVGPEAVCDIGGAHVFIGEDNVWIFDGSRPQPFIHPDLREWFYENSSQANRYRSIVRYDRQTDRVWLFYPSQGASAWCDNALVFHLGSKKWGRASRSVEAVVNYVAPGLTWDTIATVSSTWDGLSTLPWDSQAWLSGGRALAIFNTSHELKALTGTSSGGTMTVGDMGDDSVVTMMRGIRMRFSQEPTSATAEGLIKMAEGKILSSGSQASLNDGKFDLRQSGRWHRVSFTMTGPFKATAVQPELVKVGQR